MFKINGKSFIEWKYVPTKKNAVDFEISKLDNKWWEDPKWLQDQTHWSKQPKIENCKESDIETKKI